MIATMLKPTYLPNVKSNSLADKIVARARELFPTSLRLRRELHQIPEIAWEEVKTSAHLRKFLRGQNITTRKIAGTGLLAEIKAGSGKCLAIRSDIDALPINEQTGYSFKSRHPGRMHACGHDMHMATVSTAALLLRDFKSEFSGRVRFLYQPSEESPPGGAVELIRQGALENPPVNMIFGLHVNASIPTGKIAIRDGALFAGVLDFNVTITGKGGHGAIPQQTADPIVCGAAIVSELQTIVSRNVDPFEPAVITIGRVDAGTARNIIPEKCELYCTARAQSKKTLALLKRRIGVIVKQIAVANGCKSQIDFLASYPPVLNAKSANDHLRTAGRQLYGNGAVVELKVPSMGGEDFAHYLTHVPGAMFFLGVGNKKLGAVHSWHHPQFKADEDAIPIGAAVLAKAAIDFLNA